VPAFSIDQPPQHITSLASCQEEKLAEEKFAVLLMTLGFGILSCRFKNARQKPQSNGGD
jgi:hypothetical protein